MLFSSSMGAHSAALPHDFGDIVRSAATMYGQTALTTRSGALRSMAGGTPSMTTIDLEAYPQLKRNVERDLGKC